MKTALENSIKGSRTAGIKLNVWIKISTFYIIANSVALSSTCRQFFKGKAKIEDFWCFMKLIKTRLWATKTYTIHGVWGWISISMGSWKKNPPRLEHYDIKLISRFKTVFRALKIYKWQKNENILTEGDLGEVSIIF